MTAVVLVALAAGVNLLLWGLNNALDAGVSWAWTIAGQRMVYDLAADLFKPSRYSPQAAAKK